MMQSANSGLKKNSILVIGDVMLDIYYNGVVERISPEAPVPVFRKKSERFVLGGAGNVAANLAAAGQYVSLLAIAGRDIQGTRLREECFRRGIQTDMLIMTDRDTTVKTRFLAGNSQQVLRLDVEDTRLTDSELCRNLLRVLEKNIRAFDLILISDYMKGLMSCEFTQSVLKMADEYGIHVIIDVKDPQIEKYRGAYLLKPNLAELRRLTDMPADNDDEIVRAAEYLREQCKCQYVLTTCGAKGMVLTGADSEPYRVNSTGHEVFDVTGAGDTAIAYLAACMASGLSVREAVRTANCAAGVQVSKIGTSLVYPHEVRESLMSSEDRISYKLLDREALSSFRTGHAGQKIVFTNGCFDILHTGHIRCLREAAKLGDLLVVGLNSDCSVRRLKGSERPVNSQADRAEMLCAFDFVDYVTIFEEDTPGELIRILQPDVLVKGGDYNEQTVVGADFVRARGGSVVLIPLTPDKSTTGLIERLRQMPECESGAEK